MSNQTDIYEKLRTVIPTLFSDKTEIPNPYSLEDNNSNFLKKGWGIKIGSSTPETYTDYQNYTMTTEFEIVFTEQMIATSSNADPLVAVTKSLINDIATIQDDFTQTPFDTSTRWDSSDKITFINVVSISGIETATTGKYNYISKSIIFAFTHWK